MPTWGGIVRRVHGALMRGVCEPGILGGGPSCRMASGVLRRVVRGVWTVVIAELRREPVSNGRDQGRVEGRVADLPSVWRFRVADSVKSQFGSRASRLVTSHRQ